MDMPSSFTDGVQSWKIQELIWMNDELEMKIRERAHAMWEGESRPDGLAERHWLAAEREVTEETENAAVSRWAAPVKGSHVETRNEAARAAEAVRHPVARPA
jgi:hypothetical protein